MESGSYQCCILGGGPAGLGAALELTKNGVTDVVVLDRNLHAGGLSRTEVFGGARFDVGPHRFFTKNREINRLWHETLGKDFIPVNRLTRIYYRNRFFEYPIKPVDALLKLGVLDSMHAMASFAAARVRPAGEAVTFEDWITQRFGRKLYTTFFQTYTEKVWGIPCSEIGAEWAAQRIKGLDVIQVLRNALMPKGRSGIKTLVDQFDYPVLGAGQMYERMEDRIREAPGASIRHGVTVTSIRSDNGRITGVEYEDAEGRKGEVRADHFFGSIPLTHFFRLVTPAADPSVRADADALYYRDHITVNLLVDGERMFPDQWIYVHSPEVQMARIANYNNFSKAMAGNRKKTAISVEYFVFSHEPIWRSRDADIAAQAVEEMVKLKLLERRSVEGAWVVRETEAYPTYYLGYAGPYGRLKAALGAYENFTAIGRGGMYKYDNQDHATLSGLLGARNYLRAGAEAYDLWGINADEEYLETGRREG